MKNKKSKELVRLTIIVEDSEKAKIRELALRFALTNTDNMEQDGIELLLKCIHDITEAERKINVEYAQKFKGEELLEHFSDIKRYTLAAQVHVLFCFLVDHVTLDNVFWVDEKMERGYYVISKVESRGKTFCIGFDMDNFETNNYTGIANEITSDEQRTIKYVNEKDGTTFLSPSFSDCEGWVTLMVKNFQNGNISF